MAGSTANVANGWVHGAAVGRLRAVNGWVHGAADGRLNVANGWVHGAAVGRLRSLIENIRSLIGH